MNCWERNNNNSDSPFSTSSFCAVAINFSTRKRFVFASDTTKHMKYYWNVQIRNAKVRTNAFCIEPGLRDTEACYVLKKSMALHILLHRIRNTSLDKSGVT